jgi:hypothetical protein
MIRWRTRRLVNGCAAQKGTVQPFGHRNCMEAKRWRAKKAAITQARVSFSLHFSASHFSASDAVRCNPLAIAIAWRQKDGGQKKAPINQARVNFSIHVSASHFSAFDAVRCNPLPSQLHGGKKMDGKKTAINQARVNFSPSFFCLRCGQVQPFGHRNCMEAKRWRTKKSGNQPGTC